MSDPIMTSGPRLYIFCVHGKWQAMIVFAIYLNFDTILKFQIFYQSICCYAVIYFAWHTSTLNAL